MAFLNLSTFGDVPVDLDGGSCVLRPILIGGRRRAHSGVQLSTIRKRLRRWQVRLIRVPRLTGDLIVEALNSASAIGCSGDLIDPYGGSVAYCNATITEVRHPKHDGEYQLIEFVIQEEDENAGLLLFAMGGGYALPGSTFARTGTVGPYINEDGILVQAAENAPRHSWEDDDEDGVFETPTVLLEAPAFVNLVDEDDLSAWTESGSANVTGSISSPDGGTGAYRLESGGGLSDYRQRTLAFTGGSPSARSFVWTIRQGTSPDPLLEIRDTTAGAYRLAVSVSFAANGKPVPVINSSLGVVLGVRPKGDGYWAIYLKTTSALDGDNTNVVREYASASLTAGLTLDVWRSNAYDSASPPDSILNASATKAAETLTSLWSHSPRQAMCGHIRFRELESPTWANAPRIMQIGDASNNRPRLVIYRETGTDGYYIRHENDGASFTDQAIDINPSWGDLIDLFWWYYADGSVNIAARKKSPGGSWGTIAAGPPSAAHAPASAWSGQLLHFGSVGGSAGKASQAYHTSIVARGAGLSTSDLLVLSRARPHARLVA